MPYGRIRDRFNTIEQPPLPPINIRLLVSPGEAHAPDYARYKDLIGKRFACPVSFSMDQEREPGASPTPFDAGPICKSLRN